MAKTQILDVSINIPDKKLADDIQGEIESGLGGPITAGHIPTLLFIPSTGRFAVLAAPVGGNDIAFANILRESEFALKPAATSANHISPRTGFQPQEAEGEGGTPNGKVSIEQEMIKLSDTQVHYQTATNLYQKAVGMSRTALGSRTS